MPWHKIQDELEENRLAKTGSAFGSTRRELLMPIVINIVKKQSVLAICSI